MSADAYSYILHAMKSGKVEKDELLRRWDALGLGGAEKKGFPKAVVSGSKEFMAREFKEPEALLRVTETGDPVTTHPSLGEVHGWRGTGKSNFMVGKLRCLATGEDWLCYSCGREGGFKVLYVDGELPAADLQEMVELVGCSHGNFSVITGEEQPEGIPSIATDEGMRWLEEAIMDGGFEVVCLDSWSTLGNVPTNDEEYWMPFMAWLKKMRLKGISVFFGQHDGKGGTQRGHSRAEDLLNWVIQLKWENGYQGGDGLKCRMKFDKARKPIRGYSDIDIELGDDGGWLWSQHKKKQDGEDEKPKGGRKAKEFTDAERAAMEKLYKELNSWRAVADKMGVERSRITRWQNQKKAKAAKPKQQRMYDGPDMSEGEEGDDPSGF